MLAHQIS